MRIWDIAPKQLCRNHLLGEHRELHAIWSILTQGKKGYSFHPETKRWSGKLKALYVRHDRLVQEMRIRGYHHRSPLEKIMAKGLPVQHEFIHSINEQKILLRRKKCGCKI